MRILARTAGFVLVIACASAMPDDPAHIQQMAREGGPVFEVATVKISRPDSDEGRHFFIRGRRFLTLNTSLADLINFAYGLHARQIVNAPSWIDSEKFDITGIPEGEGQPSEHQWMTMIANLLTDRFKLQFRREKRDLAVYAIMPGRNGLTLTKSDGDPNGLPSIAFQGVGRLVAHNANVADLAWELQSLVLDRPVLDRSGTVARFDFTLDWTPDEFQAKAKGRAPANDPDAPPDIFKAIQSLGLRIEATRASVDVMVVEHIEKPSEN